MKPITRKHLGRNDRERPFRQPREDRSFTAATATILASGWIGEAVNRATGENGMTSLGSGIWIGTPVVATTLARLIGASRTSGRWNPATNPTWYALAAAAFPAVTGAAMGIGRAAGWVDLRGMDPARLAQSMAKSFGPGVVKNLLEESAWRGYVTEELLRRNLPDPALYLAVGAIWGSWHVPYYLFFLPEEEYREVLDLPRWQFALACIGTMLAWTVPYTELHRLSGSVWPSVLMHTVEDVLNHLTIDGHARIDPERKAILSPIVGILPTALHLGLGLTLRAVRRRAG